MENQNTAISNKKNVNYFEVAPGVWGMKIIFVNIYMIASGNNSKEWVLIDAGLKGSAGKIKQMASDLFGKGTAPSAIILTHGHFDHVGALKELLEEWDTKVYAHPLELPYLTGKSAYPPPDPSVGGGLMSLMSWTFPKGSIDLGKNVNRFPGDESVPGLSNWRVVHTPGHAPGHISLFRDEDKTLIAGDAFVTTNQQSAFAVMTQKKQLSGPPKYFTPDWVAAAKSVRKLAELEPRIAATGHGVPMSGEELTNGLQNLANNFEDIAVPNHGRYVNESARANTKGVQYVPPKPFNPLLTASVFAFGALATYAVITRAKKKRASKKFLKEIKKGLKLS